MKRLFLFKLLIFCTLCSLNAFSQEAETQIQINQSEAIKQLIEIKKEVAQNERTFQIQIYSGKIDEANEEITKASETIKHPINLVFETPNYKVRVGKFRYRIQAEKTLQEIKKLYPSAFIISPMKE